MAGGGGISSSTRELDRTPTWAVALVCAIIVIISILLEKIIHSMQERLRKGRKKPMLEALEKIKSELMVLGFISLLLTFGQNYISSICIPTKFADTMLPCEAKTHNHASEANNHRRLLWYQHRLLAADSPTLGCSKGYMPFISTHGLHQLHIFIFFLAIFHVIYSAITMTLARLKIRSWKDWECEAAHKDELNDPQRFRLTHETSFVRDHTKFWTKTPLLFYLSCFFRQFFRVIQKTDYFSMRQGFISVHLAPGSRFNFRHYIKRSMEDDFKVVVGISPLLWTSAVLFLLLNVKGGFGMFLLSIMPLVVTLSVGTKLQAIITQMAVEIKERHAVVQGIPLVQVSDRHFWFGWPSLVLHLIHLTLFQNAFEITYFFWILYEFGLNSCFHENGTLIAIRFIFGILVQILCSYSTLPLYALVTQMGSSMKKSIFDEQTCSALKKWRENAGKKTIEGKAGHGAMRTLGGSPSDSPDMSPTVAQSSAPKQMANVGASVDIRLENPPHDNKRIELSNRDLLTGP